MNDISDKQFQNLVERGVRPEDVRLERTAGAFLPNGQDVEFSKNVAYVANGVAVRGCVGAVFLEVEARCGAEPIRFALNTEVAYTTGAALMQASGLAVAELDGLGGFQNNTQNANSDGAGVVMPAASACANPNQQGELV